MRNVEVVNGQGRALTAAEFCKLADIPPEIEWFANLRNPHTRAAYEHDLREFQQFAGMTRPEEFRTVTRAHVIAWRKDLERRLCAPATIQRKLAALSSLFTYLCEHNAVLHNPVNGVKRPKSNRQEGTTPALSDEQARALLSAPQGDSLKAKRDRAILATLAYHGMRREELCKLRVQDLQRRDGVLQFRIEGKGEKVRYVPVGMKALRLITEYLEAAGHKEELEGPLFRPVQNRVTGELNKPLHPVSVYQDIVKRYGGRNYRRRAGVLCALAAGHRGDECLGPWGRYCQGAGVVRARRHLHHTDLRQKTVAAGGEPDVQNRILTLSTYISLFVL